jgi:DNA repair protein RecO (recombination protein O)
MKQFTTQGIVLTRTDYGEADRIITFLTPDHGKLKAMAKSVRKSKSKLAGGIELFSVSDLTVVVGRGEINTLISARLAKHYGNIVKDLDRTGAAYEVLRLVHRSTEDAPEKAYFNLLVDVFEALNDQNLDPEITALWFEMQLLKLTGHAPNLNTDLSGDRLKESSSYNFYHDRMRFGPQESKDGRFTARHIKFLRLGFSTNGPQVLSKVEDVSDLAGATQPLVQTMLKSYVRI